MIYKSIRIPKKNLIIGGAIAAAFLVILLSGWYFTATSRRPQPPAPPPTATFLLDAGHGGKDDGASLNGRLEKDDNLRLVKEVGRLLTEAGETVAYTRTDDTFIPLEQRSGMENSGKYRYFISIHRNSAEDHSALGAETYTRQGASDASTALAQNINDRLTRDVGFTDRGVKQKNFHVLAYTSCPAVLVETGFISNTRDNQRFDQSFDDIARAIADACLETKRQDDAAGASSQNSQGQ